MTVFDKEKVTLTLPKNLMGAIRERTSARGHSKFISDAISFYLDALQRTELEAKLIAGYQANAERDIVIAADWRSAEDDMLDVEEMTESIVTL